MRYSKLQRKRLKEAKADSKRINQEIKGWQLREIARQNKEV